MPLFDFACEACKHRWEDMHRSGEPLPACPACGATTTEKILSIGTAYVFPVIEPGKSYNLPTPSKTRKPHAPTAEVTSHSTRSSRRSGLSTPYLSIASA